MPLGVYGALRGDVLELSGMVASPDGKKHIRAQVARAVPAHTPEQIGSALAAKLRSMGASAILDAFG